MWKGFKILEIKSDNISIIDKLWKILSLTESIFSINPEETKRVDQETVTSPSDLLILKDQGNQSDIAFSAGYTIVPTD